MIGMTFGILEPYGITWYKNVTSAQMVFLLWSALGFTFNLFYNIEFRSFLIAQKFPAPINHIDQVDLLADGYYRHQACKYYCHLLGPCYLVMKLPKVLMLTKVTMLPKVISQS